jgi:hypothetical protein
MSTKRRQKQLAAIRERRERRSLESNRTSLERKEVRDRVAEAIHRSVCEFSGTDGFGECLLYAIAGMGLLGRGFGQKIYLQAGTMAVLAEPPDGWWVMDAEKGFVPGYGGEFHCWLGGPSNTGGVELIDFTARHYKRYCSDLVDATQWDLVAPGLYVRRDEPEEASSRIAWSREDPPSYVWFTDDPLDWLWLTPIRQVTEAVRARMMEHQPEIRRLIDLTVDNFNSAEAVVSQTKTAYLLGGSVPNASVLPVSLASASGV